MNKYILIDLDVSFSRIFSFLLTLLSLVLKLEVTEQELVERGSCSSGAVASDSGFVCWYHFVDRLNVHWLEGEPSVGAFALAEV